MYAASWAVLVITGFVAVQFALTSMGSGGVNISTGGPVAEWPSYRKDLGGSDYFPLEQISRDNVFHLEIPLEYHAGDFSDGSDGRQKTSFQASSIMIEGVLYFSTIYGKVVALDAELGTELWTFDPSLDRSMRRAERAIWADSNIAAGDVCQRRIFVGTLDARLISIDAKTGNPCADFIKSEQIYLSQGVDLGDYQVDEKEYGVTSLSAIIGDLVVVGSAVGDNRAATLERGIVRAFDVRSGEMRWLGNPFPRAPDDPAWATWEDNSSRSTGAANVWPPISVDAERNLIFVSSSSASPAYYGRERLGKNSYADSVVALRGRTGEAVWHSPTVHHKLWDYDVPAQPTLITVRKDKQNIPVVA